MKKFIIWMCNLGLVLAVLAGGTGCSGGPKPVKAFLEFQAGSPLNPNDKGQSLTVQVRVFSLKGKERFERARFDDLWDEPGKTLGGDFVELKGEYTLSSQSVIRNPLTLDESRQERFIGVIGDFKKGNLESWRDVVSVSCMENPWIGSSFLRVELERYQLQIPCASK